MKNNTKHLFHVFIFGVVLVFILIKVTDIVESKRSQNKYKTFFEEADEYDVLFAGSSHIFCSIYPMEIYNDYGITSYDIASQGSRLPGTYHTIINALKYASPKLMVIDLYYIFADEKLDEESDSIHVTFDAFPLSYSKIVSIDDLIQSKEKKIEMLFPLAKYHSRWIELKKADFVEGKNYYKGAEPRINLFIEAKELNIVDKAILPTDYTVGMEYLEKIIEHCQSKGIEVLLTGIPYQISDEEKICYNYGYVLAKKYNINYLDLFETKNIINYKVDMSDEGHLNQSGAFKISSYIGKYIMENYNIPDRRNDNLYKHWIEDYENYVRENIKHLENQKSNIYNYLMLLNNDEFECVISLSDEITEEKYLIIYELIKNIDGIYEFDAHTYSNIVDESGTIKALNGASDISIEVYRRGTRNVISSVSFEINQNIKIVEN